MSLYFIIDAFALSPAINIGLTDGHFHYSFRYYLIFAIIDIDIIALIALAIYY